MVTRLKRAQGFVLGFLVALAFGAAAAVFPYFGPVTGLLKGNANDYHTTLAAGTDVAAVFTGTCNSSTFLRGDGACASAGGGVTPAALTKVDDANVTLTLGGTPATSLLQATSITAGWTGTLAAARGGLGMSTVTDDTVAVANGSGWVSTVVPSCSAATSAITYDTSTNAFGCNTLSSGGVTQTTGTFTATFDNACTTSPTLTISYTLTGNVVTLNIPALTNCTSDSSSYTSNAGDMPVSIRPTSSPKVVALSAGTDNGSVMGSCVGITSGGSLFFRPNSAGGCPGGSSWTASGTKNANLNINNITYSLD